MDGVRLRDINKLKKLNMHSHAKADWHFPPADRPLYPVSGWYGHWGLPFRLFVNSKLAIILIAIFIQLVVSFGAQASGRVALVLACEKYENFKDSIIDIQWADELGQALKERNFDVTVATNRNDAQTRAVLREFSLKAERADFALIVASGHLVTYQSQSFFLPRNAKIQRATDLFSRALSLTSIADIGGKAKSGALLVLMTIPDIPATVSGVDTRPATGGQQAANVVTVFSSSPRVPASGVDRVSEQAAEKLLAVAQEEPLTLAALINGASADGLGQVFGNISDINLSEPSPSPKPEDGSRAEAAAKAQAEAERKASLAEERARDAEERAQRALEEINKIADTRSLQSAENVFSLNERREVQRRLQSLRLYRGGGDGIFGEQVKEAIKTFQKLSGAPETGYLTRNQFQQLVGTP
jgi:hypothetical protein